VIGPSISLEEMIVAKVLMSSSFFLHRITPCNGPPCPPPLSFLSEASRRRRVIAMRLKLSTAADSTSLVSAAPGRFLPPVHAPHPPPLVGLVLHELSKVIAGHQSPLDTDERHHPVPHRCTAQGVSSLPRYHARRLGRSLATLPPLTLSAGRPLVSRTDTRGHGPASRLLLPLGQGRGAKSGPCTVPLFFHFLF
jgi:hypothetical protein